MKQADPDSPKLTKHDKDVLKEIIEHAKIPDSKIASDIGISPQAVFKIRNKLEQLGVIKGYTPIIDFKKIGIHVLALIIIRVKPDVWNRYHDDVVSERFSKIPHIVAAYRVVNAQASHILLMGFRDMEQKEHYFARMQTKYSNDMEITGVYTFSVNNIITQNPIRLLNEMISKEDVSEYDLFPLSTKP